MSVRVACPHCGHTFVMDSEAADIVLGDRSATGSIGFSTDDDQVVSLHDLIGAALETAREAQQIARDLVAENELLAEQLWARDERAGWEAASECHGPFVGSAYRTHFHRLECEWAQAFLGTPRCLHFETHDEAVAAGKKPCKTCCA